MKDGIPSLQDYDIQLRKTDTGYIAAVPELNLICRNDTPDKAVEGLERLLAAHAESLEEARALGLLPSRATAPAATVSSGLRDFVTNLALFTAKLLIICALLGGAASWTIHRAEVVLGNKLDTAQVLTRLIDKAERTPPERIEEIASRLQTISVRIKPIVDALVPPFFSETCYQNRGPGIPAPSSGHK